MEKEVINLTAFREKIETFSSKFNNIFYSNYYILLLLIISFTTWVTKESLVGMYAIAIFCTLSLVFSRDITPSLFAIPLMLVTVSSSDFLEIPVNFNSIIVFAVMLTLGLIFNIVVYGQRLKTGRLSIPLVCVTVAMLMGGIGSAYIDKWADHILFVISLGPLMLALYTIAISMMHIPSNVDAKMYFAKVFTMFAVIIALQLMVTRLRLEGDFITNLRDVLNTGWANRNGLGTVLLLGLGPAFYLADNAKKGNFFMYHIGFALMLALVFSASRAALVFGFIELAGIILYLLVKGNHKTAFIVSLVMWIFALMITIGILFDDFVLMLEKFKEIGFQGNGRAELLDEAYKLFKEFPVFGVGFGYVGTIYPLPSSFSIYWFHSTPFQVVASMGVFGLMCYAYYYIARLCMWFRKTSPFVLLMMCSMLGFEGQALLDVGTFSSIPYLYLAVLMEIFVEQAGNIEDREKRNELIDAVNMETDRFVERHRASIA